MADFGGIYTRLPERLTQELKPMRSENDARVTPPFNAKQRETFMHDSEITHPLLTAHGAVCIAASALSSCTR